jgi:ElaB/YqjD/DUF883 family membrane-anchored ribosome-binding protein
MSMDSGTGTSGTPVKDAATDVAQTAKQEASQVASTAAGSAKQVATEATTQAKAVAQQAKEQVTTLLDQTKGELRSTAEQKGQQAATGLRTFADQLRSLAEGQPTQAGQLQQYVQDAQQRVQSFATRLETEGPQALLQDATRFARQRPVVFLAAAAGAGFAIGRLVRAGAAASSEQGQNGSGSYGTASSMYGTASPYSATDSYSTADPYPVADPYGMPAVGGAGAATDLSGTVGSTAASFAPPSAPAPSYHGGQSDIGAGTGTTGTAATGEAW